MEKQLFPKDFLWGASTAAHQVEGNTHNQWTEWEKANAHQLASSAPQRLGWLPGWPEVQTEATTPDNYISGTGIAHRDRYREDFALLKQLNMNAYRFSIEWASIEPKEGQWDEEAIAHYRSYIAELKAAGVEPLLTLWHWTMPVWFTDKGGFEKHRNLRYFDRFVAKVAEELTVGVRYVVTLNEPSAYVVQGYIWSGWPPQRHNTLLGLYVYWNLTAAHKRAYRILKVANHHVDISIAAHLVDDKPYKPGSLANRCMVRLMQYIANWWFLNRTRRQLDFIGLNYYFTNYPDWRGRSHNPTQPVNDLGWYMEPSGIGRLLEASWRRYRKPIIIIENGLADAADKQRKWWLEQTIDAMEHALAKGVDLRGYMHWSLLDNFEWAFGWWPKFGLVAVDRKTMKRTIRPSALWLAQKIKMNGWIA